MMANKRRFFWTIFLLFLVIASVLIIRQNKSTPYQVASGKIFGTFYQVIYQNDNKLDKELEDELRKINNEFSIFLDGSTVSAINQNISQGELTDMFLEVLKIAQETNKETDGAFDITVAPLVNAWGFGFQQRENISQQRIDSLLEIIGQDKIKLENRKIIKENPRTMLDFGAIAKGYACDVIGRMLKKNDIQNFMIEIGGEIVVHGKNAENQTWRIGVNRPDDDRSGTRRDLQTILQVTDKAIATSGNYRNFYYEDGKKYAHSINPKTGYPVEHSLLSATVIANNCATADAYATSFMVMGIEKAKKVLEKHGELSAFFIYADEEGNYKTWEKNLDKYKVK